MLPILSQPFDAFLGEDQSKSSILLSTAYSSGGSSNLYIDKLGRIRQIDGYAKVNASSLTTNTGASSVKIVNLFAFRTTTSGTFTRQLMAVLDDGADEWELWYSTDDGATWNFIVDLGASSVGKIPIFVQFGDLLYIVNGAMTARVWNGTALSSAGATQLAAPTITDAGAGPLNGNFLWKITPIKTDGSRKASSAASAVTPLQNRRATVAWVADVDTDVVGYEVSRTRGTGKVFYFNGYVNGRTTVTFTDQKSDADLIAGRPLQEHGDGPPTGIYVNVAHRGRVWWLRTDTFPRRGYYSDAGDADSVWTDDQYLDFTEGEEMGDVITGAVGDYEGMLVVGLERSIFTVSGTGRVIGIEKDWNKRRTNAEAGVAAHRSMIKVPKGARFPDVDGRIVETPANMVAYFTPLGDIRIFDGDNDTVISHAVVDTVQGFNYAQRRKVWVLKDKSRSHITWFFPSAAATECDTGVTWNYEAGTWHVWEALNFACGVEVESATAASTLLVGEARIATGGYVYTFFSGNTFDGSAIPATLMLKPFWAAEPGSLESDYGRLKRFRSAILLFETDASPVTVTYGWLGGDAGDDDAVDGSTTVSGTSRQPLLTEDSNGPFHDYGIRQRVSTSQSSGPWILTGLRLNYQVLPGMKRTAA